LQPCSCEQGSFFAKGASLTKFAVSGPGAACIEGQVHFMAKEKAKPASADEEEIKRLRKKLLEKKQQTSMK
jgi:transcription initiation factor TFIIIB Brf1 subunit/transcription initiation factor TFIIB